MDISRAGRRAQALVLAICLAAGAASAQTWSGPDGARRTYLFGHAVENFGFALTEVCLPFLLQNADASIWNRQSGVAPFPAGGPFVGLNAYLVGGSAGAIVGVGNRIGTRECTIKGHSADSQAYIDAAERTLAPLGFARLPSNLASSLATADTSPGRLIWCGPRDGVQLVAVTTTRSVGSRRTEFLLTLLELSERDARCVAIDNMPAEPASPSVHAPAN